MLKWHGHQALGCILCCCKVGRQIEQQLATDVLVILILEHDTYGLCNVKDDAHDLTLTSPCTDLDQP